MNIQTLNSDMSMRYFRFGNPDGKPMLILAGLSVKSAMDSNVGPNNCPRFQHNIRLAALRLQ